MDMKPSDTTDRMSPYAECDSLSRSGREFKRQLLNIAACACVQDPYRGHNTVTTRTVAEIWTHAAPPCFMVMRGLAESIAP
ncbi:unnamed protein product [Leptosia nina]|uniref:Uncharacterized protein n=1 Tax=Leptosia nina TaxID=320188 RepID=A0AAV1JAP2_9NEOP